MVSHHDKKGILEHIFEIRKANRKRDKIPFMSPICTNGRSVARCEKEATVYRSDIETYSCDVHAFSPYWGDLLNKSSKQIHNDWHLIDESRSIPESSEDFITEFVRLPDSDVPVTGIIEYVHLMCDEYDYTFDTAYSMGVSAFKRF